MEKLTISKKSNVLIKKLWEMGHCRTYIQEQYDLIRQGVRDVRITDDTCYVITSQEYLDAEDIWPDTNNPLMW